MACVRLSLFLFLTCGWTLHSVLQLVLDAGCSASLEGTGCPRRACPYPTAFAPLAVSGPRGVACVFSGNQRVLLYDLEEAEESDEEEEGGDEAGALSGEESDPCSAGDDAVSMISAKS